jgi:hypothetical protein
VADKIRQRHDRKQKNKVAQFDIKDFYHILNVESGNNNDSGEEENKNHAELQRYLKKTFKKDRIEDIDPRDVEDLLKPQSVVAERLKYRKTVGSLISGKKKVTVTKGERNIVELKQAGDGFAKGDLNDTIGFRCLHYSVTESVGYLNVRILKK